MKPQPATKIFSDGSNIDVGYSKVDDRLRVRLSEDMAVKELAYGRNISVGYSADGQPIEITLVELSKLIVSASEEDESTLVLTEREARQLEKMIESPLERSAHFQAGRARYRQALSAQEQATGDDVYAWMIHQVGCLRNRSLNEIQQERLADFFEQQANLRCLEFEALIRRMLVDHWKLDHHAGHDSSLIGQLREFRAKASHTLQASPSLRKTGAVRLESIWQEARLALKYMPTSGKIETPDLPENCPYTIEQLIDEANS